MEREEDDFHKAVAEMQPKNYTEHAALVALARIKLCEKRIASLHFAAGTYRGASFQGQDGTFEAQFSRMYATLYNDLNKAYSDFLMFGFISANKDLEKKALHMANERYLREGIAIMGYLNIDNNFSNSYSTLEESEFRADIAERLISKGLDPVALVTSCSECHAEKGQSCRNKKYKRISSHKSRQLKALKTSVNGKDS